MAISAAVTAGPNITTLSNIKFSDLRKHFLKAEPRDTYSGSETFPNDTGAVSASQLLRQTSFIDDGTVNEESDIDYKVPAVPNCTENSAVVTTESNWKTSQFLNTIKYYYLRQTGTNLNLNISSQSWNSNRNLNIRKWFFIDGTIGSNNNNPSARLNSSTRNLSIKISSNGAIYGKSGEAGSNNVNHSNGKGAGGDGGDAFNWSDTNTTNNYIILLSGSKLYGGGGGGGQGGDGGKGGRGGKGGVNRIGCVTLPFPPRPGAVCNPDTAPGGPGGAKKAGANGGQGAGYANQTPNLSGSPGGSFNGGGAYDGVGGNGGSGGRSGKNTAGGKGGNFGQPGTSRTSSTGKKGKKGDNGYVDPTTTFCGGSGVPPPGYVFRCKGYSTSGESGKDGTAGRAGGSGGKSIKRSTTTKPYVLIGDNSNTLKGSQGT